MKTKIDVINYLITKHKYTSYLEIGIRNPANNFDKIQIKEKEGVDPNPKGKCKHIMRSDEFFKINEKYFDIIFIDGLHVASQVEKDITNSLKFLTKNGIIVVHDCNPIKESHQTETPPNPMGVIWNGNVWKAFAKFRMTRTDLSMHVINIDHGLGIIKTGVQDIYIPNTEDIDYCFLNKNRNELLNLIDVNKFKEIY